MRFPARVRDLLAVNADLVPERMRGFVAYLDANDLPAAYRDAAMIGHVLHGMSRAAQARQSARRRAAGADCAACAAAGVFRCVLSGAAQFRPDRVVRLVEQRALETKTPPGGGVVIAVRSRSLHLTRRIQLTVALICSSVSAGLPPFGGMTPLLPVKPSIACLIERIQAFGDARRPGGLVADLRRAAGAGLVAAVAEVAEDRLRRRSCRRRRPAKPRPPWRRPAPPASPRGPCRRRRPRRPARCAADCRLGASALLWRIDSSRCARRAPSGRARRRRESRSASRNA